jgi:hypothetical protein
MSNSPKPARCTCEIPSHIRRPGSEDSRIGDLENAMEAGFPTPPLEFLGRRPKKSILGHNLNFHMQIRQKYGTLGQNLNFFAFPSKNTVTLANLCMQIFRISDPSRILGFGFPTFPFFWNFDFQSPLPTSDPKYTYDYENRRL